MFKVFMMQEHTNFHRFRRQTGSEDPAQACMNRKRVEHCEGDIYRDPDHCSLALCLDSVVAAVTRCRQRKGMCYGQLFDSEHDEDMAAECRCRRLDTSRIHVGMPDIVAE